jgi:hypothetical protein
VPPNQSLNPVGIVAWTEGALTGSWGNLVSATIDGRQYGPTTSIRPTTNVVPSSPIVLSVFPNPCNSQTTVSVDGRHSGYLRITLHDLFGRELVELNSDRVESDNLRLSISADRYSSGVYFVRAQTDQRSVARSLILLR